MEKKTRKQSRIVSGIVVGDKMQKTVVVEAWTRVLNRQYKKYVQRKSRYKAHDEAGSCKIGDKVEIVESRPFSKTKRWRVRKVFERTE